jgi:hypothetical protein
MIPTPDWNEECLLLVGGVERERGPLHELVLAATFTEMEDRPEYLIVSDALGEVDNFQIEDLRRRPDFPDMS